MQQTLRTQLKRIARDRWARRGVRILIRSAWLALAVWCIGIGLHLLLDLPFRPDMLSMLSLACIALGALLLLRPGMRPEEVARRLDRRYQLGEQLATALEVSAQKLPEGVALRLQEQSLRTGERVRRYIKRRQRFPWSDLTSAMALAALLIGLLAFTGLSLPGAWPANEPLPPPAGPLEPDQPFPPEPFTGQQPGMPAPGGEQSQGQGEQAGGGGDPATMAAIADALRDSSITRPAAEALDQGNTGAAAQSLRELADQAGQISPQTRSDLANELREAADELEQSNPGLAEQLRESANGLEGDAQSAAEALEQLAEAVEELGQQPQGQQGQGQEGQGQDAQGQQGQGQGGAASGVPGEQREQARSSDRLNVDGVPLELDNDGPGNSPSAGNPQGEAVSGSGTRRFEQRGQNPSGDRVEAGEDPLRIPADLRDVVQEYFTPPPATP